MSTIDWQDDFLVGHNEIDEEHRTFVQLIQQLETCRDAEVLQNLKELISGTEMHFAFEDRLMVEMNFPPRDCHMEEHQAVLKSGYEVLDLVNKGKYETARRYASELAKWFPAHVAQLDSALAHWITKQKYGAKPIVLKRKSL